MLLRLGSICRLPAALFPASPTGVQVSGGRQDRAASCPRGQPYCIRDHPRAGMFDAEVPTGLPIARWSVILSQWLTAYRQSPGRQLQRALDGTARDHGNWQDVVAATAAILDKHGVPAGVTLDASAGPQVDASALG